MNELKAGAARVCIDPPAEEYPFPSNFGTLDGIYDPCHVRALALESGGRRLVFVVYELSNLPGIKDLEKILADACGIDARDIILSVTHNHTSPCDRSKFPAPAQKFELFREIEKQAGIQACREAIASLRPARFGFGQTLSFCNVNRDLKTRFGFWVEGPNYGGYSDKRLSIIKFVDMEGNLIAALMNYCCHATCAFLQKDTDGKWKSSGNFPGIASRFVEEYYGGDAVALWTSGSAGNQDPILFDYGWQEFTDGYVTKIAEPDGTGYLHMEELGRRQGAEAVSCLENISCDSCEAALTYLTSTVKVPARKRVGAAAESGPFGLRVGGEGPRTDFSAPIMPNFPAFEPNPGVTVNYTLNLLRLGKIDVILTSGELYAEIGRDMIRESTAEHAFVITHIPGQGGYTLDQSSRDHKTFQAFGPVEPGTADALLIEQSRRLSQLAEAEAD
ncbi:MAG: hypothetical protein LUD82_06855 [Clostridiales bacterium]|nr:hypothetical protein [Clostridiales bacterium]